MNIYNIADLNVVLECEEWTLRNAEKYIIDSNDIVPDIYIKTPKEDIRKIPNPNIDYATGAYLLEGKLFYKELISKYKGTMLHASAVVVDEKAYLFSAPCGTGKSTHTSKWLELFGDGAYILNDDKPAIRVLDDGIYAYGTPWSGKHDISVNKRVKLQAICFLNRDTTNWIKPMEDHDKIVNLYYATIKRIEKDLASNLFDIIGDIIDTRLPRPGCHAARL